MTVVRVKGFKIFRDRHGKMRCYHRKTNEPINLDQFPLGTVGFLGECARIRAVSDAIETLTPKPGTLGGLMAFFIATDHFKDDLSKVSQEDYLWCREFLKDVADTPVHAIDTPLIAGFHNIAHKKHGYRRANYIKTFLSEVFKYAIPEGLIDKNYAVGVINKKRPKGKPKANLPWTPDQVKIVFSNAPTHIRSVLGVMLATGLDPSDALGLPKEAVQDGVVWDWRNKTDHEQAVPVGPLLEAVIKGIEPHDAPTLLANSRGKSWTYSGFASSWHTFRKQLVEAGHPVKSLTLKALRHTLATSLREKGIDERSIADVLGQKTPAMARHYSRNAALAKKNKKTMKSIRKREKALAEVVKPSSESVKPSRDKESDA